MSACHLCALSIAATIAWVFFLQPFLPADATQSAEARAFSILASGEATQSAWSEEFGLRTVFVAFITFLPAKVLNIDGLFLLKVYQCLTIFFVQVHLMNFIQHLEAGGPSQARNGGTLLFILGPGTAFLAMSGLGTAIAFNLFFSLLYYALTFRSKENGGWIDAAIVLLLSILLAGLGGLPGLTVMAMVAVMAAVNAPKQVHPFAILLPVTLGGALGFFAFDHFGGSAQQEPFWNDLVLKTFAIFPQVAVLFLGGFGLREVLRDPDGHREGLPMVVLALLATFFVPSALTLLFLVIMSLSFCLTRLREDFGGQEAHLRRRVGVASAFLLLPILVFDWETARATWPAAIISWGVAVTFVALVVMVVSLKSWSRNRLWVLMPFWALMASASIASKQGLTVLDPQLSGVWRTVEKVAAHCVGHEIETAWIIAEAMTGLSDGSSVEPKSLEAGYVEGLFSMSDTLLIAEDAMSIDLLQAPSIIRLGYLTSSDSEMIFLAYLLNPTNKTKLRCGS